MKKTPRSLDEHIAQSIRASEQSGEMQAAKDYGKPLDFGDGYDEAPPELRMAFKALKDAGFVPPEVELLRRLAEMRALLLTLDDSSEEAAKLRGAISELQVRVSVRMERLAKHGI